MQENDFEQNIRQQMDGFILAPDDAVWQKVAVRIATEKKRRRLIFFWLFAALLAGGGVVRWILSDNGHTFSQSAKAKNHADTARQNAKAFPQNAGSGKPTITSAPAVNDPVAGAVKNDTSANISQQNFNITNNKRIKTEEAIPSPAENSVALIRLRTAKQANTFVPQSASQNAVRKGNIKQLVSAVNISADDSRSLNNDDHFNAHITFGHIEKMPRDSTLAKAAINPLNINDIAKQVALLNLSTAAASPTIKKKHLSFGVSLSVGISDNVSKLPLISGANTSANYSTPDNLNIGQPQPQPGVFNAMITYTSGFSFSAGMFTKFNISKRLSATAGIDYQYYSALSKVGSTTNTAQRLYDSVLRSNADVEKSFTSGNSATFINRYHYLSVPLILHWKLSMNPRRGASLFAGLSPSVQIASTALYANARQRIFYEESGQFNRFQLTAQGGFMVDISNNSRYKINIGPTAQYGLRNMAKRELNLQQHLFFFGIKTNIIFQQ